MGLRAFSLRMTLEEAIAWAEAVLPSRRYLEWGSGGTTHFAAFLMMRPAASLLSVHSVESSSAWLDHLQQQSPLVVHAMEVHRLTFHRPDLGKVGEWARPLDWQARPAAERAAQSRSYSLPDALASACCFDTILVDGRFRAACLLQALRLSLENTTVLLHDVNDSAVGASERRASYQVAMRWYTTVKQRGSMAVLRPKKRSLSAAKDQSTHFRTALWKASDDFM